MTIRISCTTLFVMAFSFLAYSENIRILSVPLTQNFVQNIELPTQASQIDEKNQFYQFCNGVGAKEVDILFTSNKITQKQIELCQKTGVYDILEMPLAYNAILLQTASLSVNLNLDQSDLYRAVRAYERSAFLPIERNIKTNWDEVNKKFKDIPLNFVQQTLADSLDKLYLDYIFTNCFPPKEKDLKVAVKNKSDYESFLHASVNLLPFIYKVEISKNLTKQQNEYREVFCHELRNDLYQITAVGQFNNLKNSAFPADQQVFIMPFQNGDKNLLTLRLNGKVPTAETIKAKEYPLGYPIYIYIKMAHIGAKNGLKEFTDIFIGSQAEDIRRQAKKLGYIAPNIIDIENAQKAYRELKGYIVNNEGLNEEK